MRGLRQELCLGLPPRDPPAEAAPDAGGGGQGGGGAEEGGVPRVRQERQRPGEAQAERPHPGKDGGRRTVGGNSSAVFREVDCFQFRFSFSITGSCPALPAPSPPAGRSSPPPTPPGTTSKSSTARRRGEGRRGEQIGVALLSLSPPGQAPTLASVPPGGGYTSPTNLEYPHSLQIFQVVNLAHYSYSLQYLHYPHSLHPSPSL